MHFLLSLLKPVRILELGSFTGYSAALLQHSAPSNAVIHCVEKSAEYCGVLRGNVPTVHIHNTACTDFLSSFNTEANGKFDFCFVDADKRGYEGYGRVLRDRQMVGAGGMILFDNVLLRDKVLGHEGGSETVNVMRRFVERAVSKRGALILPAFDGILIEQVT
jgi:predicted O-methyltransferase YrrM